MELDLQRFYNVNRRALMWIIFFGILYLLRQFFAVMFMTFIFGFLMRKVAKFLVDRVKLPYRAAVIVPYLVSLGLLIFLLAVAIPMIADESNTFRSKLPDQFDKLAIEIEKFAHKHGWEETLQRLVVQSSPPAKPHPIARMSALTYETADESIPASLPAEPTVSPHTESTTEQAVSPTASLTTKTSGLSEVESHLLDDKSATIASINAKLSESLQNFFPIERIKNLLQATISGILQFLLAILLSFLIVLDFDRVTHELQVWRQNTVGRFFHEAAASVVEFSEVVGTAFQCQMIIAMLNASITCIGLMILGIKPVALLTTLVLLCGLIPVLGVFISSVPILLIAFNDGGLNHALIALAFIIFVHLLEAYVFNPRIYAARFHLNPVIVLIILLIAHEMFGVWGMLLSIPVTHYVLNIAQMPSHPRRHRRRTNNPQEKTDDAIAT